MAKYETNLKGDFYEFLEIIENGVMSGSISASFEDGSDMLAGDIKCAVRVYERYSVIGKNRVSLNITLVGNGSDLYLSAITSGGSQAIFFEFNTFGEESFLDSLVRIVERYNKTQ